MSSLNVKVCQIDAVRDHPNADALEIAEVGGWQCVVPKAQEWKVGDACVYFPPDTVIPEMVADLFGVKKYLSPVAASPYPLCAGYRIRCARLRGEASFGLVVRPMAEGWCPGDDVAGYYNALKYDPPMRATAGDAIPDDERFAKYTDIENLRNNPDVLVEGEVVSVTEKIHGTLSRTSLINGEWMAGSKQLNRRKPDDADLGRSTYWFPYSNSMVRDLIKYLAVDHKQVVLYGEVFGKGVQNLAYGEKALAYRAFDIMCDGKYMDVRTFRSLCVRFDVPMVPELARLSYSLEAIKAMAAGNTTLMDGNAHIREGVVVKPLEERTDPRVGRVVLKYISNEYLLGQKGDTTDA